ncbi:hypothetical protein [Lundtoftevirus Lu221]|uniref:Uncharacterized protein n=1 Tax=phage PKM.Lu.22.1 TaxID=3049197 RepID=A0AAF0RBC9_9CAUD|nr:hypothetical protein [phage PKM.Lu.22.1]
MADSNSLSFGALALNTGINNLKKVVNPVINTSLAENDFKEQNGRYPNSKGELNTFIKQGGQSERDRRNPAPTPAPAQAAPEQAPGEPFNPSSLLVPVQKQLPTQQIPDSAQDKAAHQRGALNQQAQGKAQAVAKARSQGYQDVPNAAQDPAGNLAARNANKAAGVGGQTGEINFNKDGEVPSPQQAQNMQLDQLGKKTAFNMDDMPEWYESNSFNYGLISFGLNLLSGNDLATSFGAAGEAFSSMYGQERRQMWAQDLISQGYSPTEVEEYIRTGKSDVLTDPMEKQAKQIQMATGLANLEAIQYENSDEERQYKKDQDKFERDIKIQQLNDSRAARAESAALRREQMAINQEERELRRQERAEKAAAKGQEYKESLAKAENWYTRARQGYKNYEDTVKSYGGVNNIYSDSALGKITQAALTDAVFSGNSVKEAVSKGVDEKFVTTVNREREFLAPLLRKDSGAAISQSEWKTTGEIYFPRPGDTQQTIDQKAQSRVVAMLATNPHASGELRGAVDAYTRGEISSLREKGGRVYAQLPDGRWLEIQQ